MTADSDDPRNLLIDGLEKRILHSSTPLAPTLNTVERLPFAASNVVDSVDAVATQRPPIAPVQAIRLAAGTFNSDPAGLTDTNSASTEPMVFIVDENNPNAIFDTSGITRDDVDGTTPLGSLAALAKWGFLQKGDTIYLRKGDYTIEKTIQIEADSITIASYPGEQAVIRHGSFTYDWAVKVKGDGFTMNNVDFVGHKQTDQGKLYSSLGVLIQGNNATIENSIFRHNANFRPADEGGDIAFGKRVDADGNLLKASVQDSGRLVAFAGNENGVFRNNVVAVFEKETAERFTRGAIDTEGLLILNAKVLVEHNQFGAAGHQSLSIRNSTVVVRHNTFGDVSNYAQTLGISLSKHVQTPSTHTAAALHKTNGSEFSHNVVTYNHADPNDSGYGLQIQASSHSEVFNNLFINSGGIGFAIGLGISPTNSSETELAFNRIYNNSIIGTSTPISLGYYASAAPTGLTKIHDNEIFNNVITMSEREAESANPSHNSPIRLNVSDEDTADRSQIYNNILYHTANESVTKSVNGGNTRVFNIASLNQTSFANSNVHVQPIFSDEQTGDFSLRVANEAVPLFTATSDVPATDLLGRNRQRQGVGAFDLSVIPGS